MKQMLLRKRVDIIVGIIFCMVIPLKMHNGQQAAFAGYWQYPLAGVYLVGSFLLNLQLPREVRSKSRLYFGLTLAIPIVVGILNFCLPLENGIRLWVNTTLMLLLDFYPIISGWYITWYFSIQGIELTRMMKKEGWDTKQQIKYKKGELLAQLIVLAIALLFWLVVKGLGFVMITYAVSAVTMCVLAIINRVELLTAIPQTRSRKIHNNFVFLLLGTYSIINVCQMLLVALTNKAPDRHELPARMEHNFGFALFLLVPILVIWYFELTYSELKSLKNKNPKTNP